MEITKNSLDYLNITSLSKTYYQILKFREPLKVIFTGKHCVCVYVCVCVCVCVCVYVCDIKALSVSSMDFFI